MVPKQCTREKKGVLERRQLLIQNILQECFCFVLFPYTIPCSSLIVRQYFSRL